MEHFLQVNIPLRHLLNAKPLFISWWRSAFNEVNDWAQNCTFSGFLKHTTVYLSCCIKPVVVDLNTSNSSICCLSCYILLWMIQYSEKTATWWKSANFLVFASSSLNCLDKITIQKYYSSITIHMYVFCRWGVVMSMCVLHTL